jgi:hypothetical protein
MPLFPENTANMDCFKTESGPPQWEAASNCLSYGMAQVRAWYKYICSLNSVTYSTDYINIITEWL